MASPTFGILALLVCTLTSLHMAAAGTIAPSASATRLAFAKDMFNQIVTPRTHENVVYSPTSIQACLMLAFIGAEGETEQEMRNVLHLGVAEKKLAVKNFGDFVRKAFQPTTDSPEMFLANGIFVNENLAISPAFAEIAQQYPSSETQAVPFADANTAAETINSWVAEHTADKIQNLLDPYAINGDTSAILVNALYFKALWEKPFSNLSTHSGTFSINSQKTVSVNMMHSEEEIRYVELPDLAATAVELPYKNSDLTMMIVLPNEVEGLKSMEEKLATVQLSEISDKMKVESVNIYLPQFNIVFDVDLKQPLQTLGMKNMFSATANFSSLFTDSRPQRISDIKHKVILKVNEAGSEAIAATVVKMVPMALNLGLKPFTVDHPFFFAIRSRSAVFFTGHVATFAEF